jgi:methylglutaconyl-CoA hydratase
MADVVKVERRDGAAWLTIDRAEAMNALSGEVLTQLGREIDALGGDPSVRAVVITGAGDKAFCAGADLKERRGMDEAATRVRIDLINSVFTRLSRLGKATIAAMNGVAFGGGLELALCCDFRLAVAGGQLGLTEVRLGIMPGAGGTQRLLRLIGIPHAKEMILLGRRISSERALAIGLVHEVVPAAQLVDAVGKLLAELGGAAPRSISMAKRAIDEGANVDIDEGLKIERQCYEVTLATEDRNEGLRAFAEKRPPRFQGQ